MQLVVLNELLKPIEDPKLGVGELLRRVARRSRTRRAKQGIVRHLSRLQPALKDEFLPHMRPVLQIRGPVFRAVESELHDPCSETQNVPTAPDLVHAYLVEADV